MKLIRSKEYVEKFKRENMGKKILAVAICYDSKEKEHHCLIEEMDLISACKFATKCSSVTVCRYGAQDSMPTLEEIC